MKPDKKILKLIHDRMECADKLNHLNHQVIQWLRDHNVDTTELESSYGCLLTTEPCVYAELTRKAIENTEESVKDS